MSKLRFVRATLSVWLFLLTLSISAASAQAPLITGANVNMVSGTTLPTGDPYLRQQNGPTLAVSTRNPLHILGGANDYRTIDYPGGDINADAWMGVFKSIDGGKSWKSTLLPGFPQDTSPEGLASPAHGWKAGSDVVVRAGTNGLFYYIGMAFQREPDPAGIIFAARFIDSNNKENADTIHYLNTVQIGKGKATAFLDKPSVAVDVPRLGARLCTVRTPGDDGKQITQIFPGGTVYVAYTIIDFANVNTETSKVMLTHSTNCGQTWSDPVRLSGPNTINQGGNIAIDPDNGDVYVAWRQFYTIDPKTKKVTEAPAIMISKSTNEGNSFSKPVSIPDAAPFNRPRLPSADFPNFRSFRSIGYASLAIDQTGRVYVAWPQWTGDDIRVAISSSRKGVSGWTKPILVDPPPAGQRAYQAMPSLTFAGGKLAVAYYDFRDDWLAGFSTIQGVVLDVAPDQPLWHVIDVRVATALPGESPKFTSKRVSKYHYAYTKDAAGQIIGLTQLDYNAPNYPLFADGTTPYIGDYIDIAPSPAFVTDFLGRWIYNTDSKDAPVFHTAWADNRDVLPPKDGNWALYKVPGGMCTDPVVRVGMRNQNIYSSEISEGLVVSSPGNTKPIGKIQRSFVIWVKNTTAQDRTFRLTTETLPIITRASFLQFESRSSLDVRIGKRSSIARAVFVTSLLPRVPVRVKVVEIEGVGQGVKPGGLQSSTVLNRDLLNPELLDPDLPPGSLLPPIEDAEDYTPDILDVLLNPNQPNSQNLDPSIFADLVARGLANPDILNPDILNPDILNPDILNPDILNPDILNPDILNPDIPSADPAKIAVQDISWETTNQGNTTSAFTFKTIFKNKPQGFNFQLLIYRLSYSTGLDPKTCKVVNIPHQELLVNILHPDILNPDILNPDILNPSVENATYYAAPGETIKVKLRALNLDKDVNKITVTSRSGVTRTLTAGDGKAAQELIADPLDTIAFNGEPLNAAVVAHEVNTEDAEDGVTQPPVATTALTVTTSSLPLAEQNQPYSRQLTADGDTPPAVWTIIQGAQSLSNAGLTLSSTGLLSSPRVTQTGTFPFTVQVQDAASPTQIATADLVLVVGPPDGQAALLFVTQPSVTRAGDAITPTVSVQARNAAGNPASGVTVTIRLMSGSTDASVNFAAGSTTQATTNSNGIAAFSNVVINVPGTSYRLRATTGSAGYQPADSALFTVLPGVSIGVSPAIPDGVVGRPYPGVTFTATGGLPPRTWDVVNPSLLPPGLSLNSATGAISGTPTTAGNYTFTIRVVDAGTPAQSDTRSIMIRIGAPLTIQDVSPLPDARAGQRYIHAFTLTGGIGTRTCAVTPANPVPGINLIANTCTLDGIPATPGNYSFTLRATDQSSPVQNPTKDFMLRVIDDIPRLAFLVQPTSGLANATINPPVQVAVTDALGNIIGNSTRGISLFVANSPGGGNLTGTTAANAVNGVATFSNLSVDKPGNGYTLRAVPEPSILRFDELPTQPANNLTVNGATFRFQIGGVDSLDANFASFGPGQTGFVQDPSLEGNTAGILTIDFAAPTRNLNFGMALLTSASTSGFTVQLFDPNLVSLATIPVNVELRDAFAFSDAGFGYAGAPVRRVVIDFNEAAASRFALDNLRYDSEGSGGILGATSAPFNVTTGSPAMIVPVLGDGQAATVNVAFPTPLQASVRDASNNPVSGVTVTFAAPTSGAGGTFAAGLATVNVTTNTSGLATAPTLTANNVPGSFFVTASAPGLPDRAVFNLTNVAAGTSIDSIQPVSVRRGEFNVNFQINGNNLDGGAVEFRLNNQVSQQLTLTNINNSSSTQLVATLAVTTGAAIGTYNVSVVKNGVASNSANLTVFGLPSVTSASLDGTSPGVQFLEILRGSTVTLTATGTDFRVTDSMVLLPFFGVSPLGGVGTTTFNEGVTRATATVNIPANAPLGQYVLQVRPQNGNGSSQVIVRVTSGVPISLSINGGNLQTGSPGSVLADPLLVLAHENSVPVGGLTITFAPGTGGGSVRFASFNDPENRTSVTVLTGANGTAAARGVLGPAAGTHSFIATLAGSTQSVEFTATASGSTGSGPTIDSIQPLSVRQGELVGFRVAGSNLAGGSVEFRLNNQVSQQLSVNEINNSSSTQLLATLRVGTGAPVGTYNVSVLNSGQRSNSANLSVFERPNVTGGSLDGSSPGVQSLEIVRGTTVRITATGTEFRTSDTLTIRHSFDGSILGGAGTTTFNQAVTAATATVNVPVDAPLGIYRLYVSAQNTSARGSLVTVRVKSAENAQITLNIDSGNTQTGAPGSVLANPLVVNARENGLPIGGLLVTFAPGTGGGSVRFASFNDTQNRPLVLVTTDMAGKAAARGVLGPAAGNHTFVAAVSGGPQTVEFSAISQGTTFTYNVVVTSASGSKAGFFSAGTPVTISYTLNALAADSNSDPGRGIFNNAVQAMSASFPAIDVSVAAGAAGTAQTFNNVVDVASGQVSDQVFFFGGPISFSTSLSGESVTGIELDFLSTFVTPPAEPLMLSSDVLPLFQLPLIDAFLILRTASGSTFVRIATP